MSSPANRYLQLVRNELMMALTAMDPSLAINNGSSIDGGYPIRPIVELPDLGKVTKQRLECSAREFCLLEYSSNSVRISFALKQQSSDAVDQIILAKYVHFFQQRALAYDILRRKTISVDYAISFLITNEHVRKYGSTLLVKTILDFVSQVDKECSYVKISINSKARSMAAEFLKGF